MFSTLVPTCQDALKHIATSPAATYLLPTVIIALQPPALQQPSIPRFIMDIKSPNDTNHGPPAALHGGNGGGGHGGGGLDKINSVLAAAAAAEDRGTALTNALRADQNGVPNTAPNVTTHGPPSTLTGGGGGGGGGPAKIIPDPVAAAAAGPHGVAPAAAMALRESQAGHFLRNEGGGDPEALLAVANGTGGEAPQAHDNNGSVNGPDDGVNNVNASANDVGAHSRGSGASNNMEALLSLANNLTPTRTARLLAILQQKGGGTTAAADAATIPSETNKGGDAMETDANGPALLTPPPIRTSLGHHLTGGGTPPGADPNARAGTYPAVNPASIGLAGGGSSLVERNSAPSAPWANGAGGGRPLQQQQQQRPHRPRTAAMERALLSIQILAQTADLMKRSRPQQRGHGQTASRA